MRRPDFVDLDLAGFTVPVDQASAYFRLTAQEEGPLPLYQTLRELLWPEERGESE